MKDKDDNMLIDENGESCSKCGLYIENCECSNHEDKIEDFCLVCLEPLTIEQKLKGVCSQHD